MLLDYPSALFLRIVGHKCSTQTNVQMGPDTRELASRLQDAQRTKVNLYWRGASVKHKFPAQHPGYPPNLVINCA